MPALPSTLALTTIQTSQQILSADHRNNYGAIQTGWNSLIGILDDGVTGDVLTGVGSTLAYAKPPGYEYAYNEATANVAVTATTEASGNTVVTASAVTFDGATPVVIEFYSPYVVPNAAIAATVVISLWDGAASLGHLAQVTNPAAALMGAAVNARRRLTPSAAAHTYSIKAWRVTGDGTISMGVGGSGAYVPGFIRITKA